MKIKLDNAFRKWHAIFVILYLMTFTFGWLRSTNTFFYKYHPIVGISSVILPLTYFILSKDKILIIRMIKSNFNLKGHGLIKLAKLSTMVILFYYLISVLSGFILNNSLYSSYNVYKALSNVHGLSKFIVPIAVMSHVYARLRLKSKRKTGKT